MKMNLEKKVLITLLTISLFCRCEQKKSFQFAGDYPTFEYSKYQEVDGSLEKIIFDDSTVHPRNRIYVKIDTLGEILLNNQSVEIDEFKGHFLEVYQNLEKLSYLPENPRKVQVLFAVDGETIDSDKDKFYQNIALKTENIMISAVYELRDDYAQGKLNKRLRNISSEEQKKIVEMFPFNISVHRPESEAEQAVSSMIRKWNHSGNLPLLVRVSKKGQITVDSLITAKEKIQEEIQERLLKAVNSSDEFVVRITNEKGVDYELYLETYQSIKSAFEAAWEMKAQIKYQKSYDELTKSQKREITNEVPLRILEGVPEY